MASTSSIRRLAPRPCGSSLRATSSPPTGCRLQAQRILALVPMPNAPGRDGGTRENFQSSGSEEFKEDSVNVRLDGRIGDSTNTFGRYSVGDFFRDGPTSFGAGGGQELVTLGGISDVKNQSLAIGLDRAFSSTLLADFRFGWFRYKVAVLPFDFGTTPAADAGIPGLNVIRRSARGCLPASSKGTAASTLVRAWVSTAATVRSIRMKSSGSWSATSPRCSAITASRPVSTSGGRTTSGCRATPTGPAS